MVARRGHATAGYRFTARVAVPGSSNVRQPQSMSRLENVRSWYRWGHWLDTPQGICVLLSVPVCWLAAVLAFAWPVETRPLFLSDGPVLFLFTPLLAYLYFLRFGQLGEKQFSSSILTTVVVLAVIGIPFYVPYLRSHVA